MPLKLKPPALPNQPPPDTPTTATSAKRKLTLTFGSASSPVTNTPSTTPAAAKPKASRKPKADKPIRASKPTPKKRDLDAALADDTEAPKQNGFSNVKRLKLSVSGISKPRSPSPPKDDGWEGIKHIRAIFKGRIPERPIGVGYDSASSDVEEDPALEEEFILRMQPGEDCEYVRQAIAERRWGSTREGGANVRMQFLRKDGRRAVVSVQKHLYAACLVDLPCVVEAMKSWDKKAWFKTADVCQMLMVLGRIEKEDEALEYPLPRDVDPKTWQYAHGITPPMRYARKRRFRKRISKNAIEAVEEEVDRLLALDAACSESKYEVIDPDRFTQEQQERRSADGYGDDEDVDEDDDDEDAEGEEDIENNYEPIVEDDEGDDAAMEAALAAAMEDDEAAPETATTADSNAEPTTQPLETTAATSPSPTTGDTPSQPRFISDSEAPSAAATPAAQTTTTSADDDDDNSSDESDEDAPSELDDTEVEQKQERERRWAEINDIKVTIKTQESRAAAQPNAILKNKILDALKGLYTSLDLKMAALGVDEEAVEEEEEGG
ncbi:MAG: hypothetical protein Q9216_005356 [Gyalolechia sp. 2 TL-2023]